MDLYYHYWIKLNPHIKQKENQSWKTPSSASVKEKDLSTAPACQSARTWNGVLPARSDNPSGYSCKVFLDGIPRSHVRASRSLMKTFKSFAPIKAEQYCKELETDTLEDFAHITLPSENNVRDLLRACTEDDTTGTYHYSLPKRRKIDKKVKVVPWCLDDANYTMSTKQLRTNQNTVIVRALHCTVTAKGLATIMDDLFKGVLFAGIITDISKYPSGSAIVTFDNSESQKMAVSTFQIKIKQFEQKVRIDPYLIDSLCSKCGVQPGPYFCREYECFNYFCKKCWDLYHHPWLLQHQPVTKDFRDMDQYRFGNVWLW